MKNKEKADSNKFPFALGWSAVIGCRSIFRMLFTSLISELLTLIVGFNQLISHRKAVVEIASRFFARLGLCKPSKMKANPMYCYWFIHSHWPIN